MILRFYKSFKSDQCQYKGQLLLLVKVTKQVHLKKFSFDNQTFKVKLENGFLCQANEEIFSNLKPIELSPFANKLLLIIWNDEIHLKNIKVVALRNTLDINTYTLIKHLGVPHWNIYEEQGSLLKSTKGPSVLSSPAMILNKQTNKQKHTIAVF